MYFSDRQLGERFNVSRVTIWRWARDPAVKFPEPVKLSPGCARWRLDDVEAWEAGRLESA
ncbi:MAG: AlpA family transcriptional regulator [Alphaproteobacteria bacterium HGW-Alphaproteobacteria-13]|nr:MAG: AlpA family transcriptional regulator [Alphaproteobacteria bacterium HGW-Alphaproteobacteria-13]